MERPQLSEILRGSHSVIASAWETTEAAKDFVPLPAGEYIAHIISGELFNSKSNNTPGYKLTFKVIEGDYEGRHFWSDCWLTEAALPMTKRDLSKLGITSFEQLDQPLPQGIRVKAKLTLRRDDDGAEYNRLRSFEFVSIDTPIPDPFAPKDKPTEIAKGDASFEFGHNRQEADTPAESIDSSDLSQDDNPTVDGVSLTFCESGAGI